MKSVLISIRPKWCILIASGKKTIEVRKTRPKIECPFKCYMYMTKDAKIHYYTNEYGDIQKELIPQAIVGEFTCDRIEDWQDDAPPPVPLKDCCLTYSEVRRYGGTTETLYLWHISNLVIYDKPKELADFWKPGRCPYNKNGCRYPYHCYRSGQIRRCGERLEKPPQSWCYVEEST